MSQHYTNSMDEICVQSSKRYWDTIIIFSNGLVTIGEDKVKHKTTNNKTYFDYENNAIL